MLPKFCPPPRGGGDDENKRRSCESSGVVVATAALVVRGAGTRSVVLVGNDVDASVEAAANVGLFVAAIATREEALAMAFRFLIIVLALNIML